MNNLYHAKKCFLSVIFAFLFAFNGFAQNDSIYIYKNASVIYRNAINKIDSIKFAENTSEKVLNIHFQDEIVFSQNVSEIDSINFNPTEEEKEDILTGKNWMSKINDTISLRSISIPGTHDSGTSSGGGILSSFAKCQNWNIETQLNNGIRFLDMRFKVQGERLKVYHGIAEMDLWHDDFFNIVRQFLTDNPTETVIISIRNENDGANADEKLKFRQLLDTEMETNANKWIIGSGIPQLSEARGKMILFRRYDGNKGINMFNGWSDNATFSISGGRVQDVYSISGTSDNSINSKWEHISALLNEAYENNGNRFFVNFCSANAGTLTTPKSVADKINPKLQSFLDTAAKGSWGWILMDFPTEKLVSDIYLKNIP
jgi:Phosphatidylinositol-specific phospholipase C, X domain.